MSSLQTLNAKKSQSSYLLSTENRIEMVQFTLFQKPISFHHSSKIDPPVMLA
jgi:hypothetical protein